MTINDQIRDKKLQYDINREAAKLSALSSSKIHKYEYLTGEDTLPSNQQQIIEQAKFTYSPLGKLFKKEIQTIEDQGKKQIDALESLKPKEQKKQFHINRMMITSKEIYNEILEERIDEIPKMSKEISYSNLVYDFKGPTSPTHFSEYGDPMYIYGHMKNGEKTLPQVEEEQNYFKKDLNQITSGDPKYKSEKE